MSFDLLAALQAQEPIYPIRFSADSYINVLVVGAGGTGARVALDLARIAYDAKRSGIKVRVGLCDGDKVERKNVGRQLFVPADIGRNKAEVIAEIANADYGIGMVAYPFWFDMTMFVIPNGKAKKVNNPTNRKSYTWEYSLQRNKHFGFASGDINLIVGCVDETQTKKLPARWHIAQVCHNYQNVWWLDCGNDLRDGQVSLGNSGTEASINTMMGIATNVPSPAIQMPDIIKPSAEPKPDESCADLTARREQGLMVNSMIATVASQYLYKIVIERALDTFYTYADTGTMEMTSKRVTQSAISEFGVPFKDTSPTIG